LHYRNAVGPGSRLEREKPQETACAIVERSGKQRGGLVEIVVSDDGAASRPR
jgi:hypothetical protein